MSSFTNIIIVILGLLPFFKMVKQEIIYLQNKIDG